MNCIYLAILKNCFAGRQCDYTSPSFYIFCPIILHTTTEEFGGKKMKFIHSSIFETSTSNFLSTPRVKSGEKKGRKEEH